MGRRIRVDLGPSKEAKKVDLKDDLKARIENREFGNFPGYFNYRNKAAPEAGGKADPNATLDVGLSDDRLQHFKKEWFEGRMVLDIGCNRGHITYAIARLYEPKTIIGLDIDLKMVNMANRDIHLHIESMIDNDISRRVELAKTAANDGDRIGEDVGEADDTNRFALASYIDHGPVCIDSEETSPKFPNNLFFIEHNYVLDSDEMVAKQTGKFETIVCLSVTKWVHLNFGDSGLKRFLKRIYNHLKPGGLLILEAQPFTNYKRRGKLSDLLKANYRSIQFKPEEIDSYLLSDEVGFKEIVNETVTEHQCPGFKRPLKVFRK